MKFYVDKEVYDVIERLSKRKRNSPFYRKDMKYVFLYATILGVLRGARCEQKAKKDIADIDVFKEHEKDFLRALAFYINPNVNLENLGEVLKTIVEFTNGGLALLKDLLICTDPKESLEVQWINILLNELKKSEQ